MNNWKKLLIIISIILLSLIIVVINMKPDSKSAFFETEEYQNDTPVTMPSPHMEKPVSLAQLIELNKTISLNEVRNKNIKIAISMHDLDNDWSEAVISGLKPTLEHFNVEIVAITNGEFKIDKQIYDIKNLIELKPDILISLPLDTVAMIDIYKEVLNNDIDLLFIDTIPIGFKPVKDYIGLVIGDSYQLGVLSAKSLIQLIGGSGNIAMLNWANEMYTVDQRTLGAEKTFEENKNINIVEKIEFNDFYEIPELITELLVKYPDLVGLWTVWDTPALEAVEVLKYSKPDVVVSTVDMSRDVANSILNDKLIKTTSVDHPYYAGIAAGLLSIYSYMKIDHPSYVVTHADIVTRENLTTKWEELYHKSYITE